MVEKVIPPSLNYADLKPEAIENEVRLVRFVPTATVNNARQNDIVKFMLQGNGFYDPYSAYLKFTVKVDDLAVNEVRTVDRSAHSFINRLVVRSQGVEIERIEQYDVIAAEINQMLYSQEQKAAHSHEGFASQSVRLDDLPLGLLYDELHSNGRFLAAAGGELFEGNAPQYCSIEAKKNGARAINLLSNNSSSLEGTAGEPCFFNGSQSLDLNPGPYDEGVVLEGSQGAHASRMGHTVIRQTGLLAENAVISSDFQPMAFQSSDSALRRPGLAYHLQLPRVSALPNDSYDVAQPVPMQHIIQGKPSGQVRGVARTVANNGTRWDIYVVEQREITFCVPLYSGIIGVLMPDKKLVPLSLMPLDVEFTLNPHALYSSLIQGGSRNYTVTKMELFAHMLFFEQEVHRSLEAVVAEHGIFIHFQSFYLAPVTVINGTSTPNYAQLMTPFKSINSVHSVFIYNLFDTVPLQRKLNFSSHNLTKLQLRNGTFLLPSEPIEGGSGDPYSGQHVQYVMELFKGWNKMHDPATDADITPWGWGRDFCPTMPFPAPRSDAIVTYAQQPGGFLDFGIRSQVDPAGAQYQLRGFSYGSAAATAQTSDQAAPEQLLPPSSIYERILNNQCGYGKTMYAISFEGDELGTDKNLITGKKAMLPFDIIMQGTRLVPDVPSYMFNHLRCDFVVYVRPDLVVTVLGR